MTVVNRRFYPTCEVIIIIPWWMVFLKTTYWEINLSPESSPKRYPYRVTRHTPSVLNTRLQQTFERKVEVRVDKRKTDIWTTVLRREKGHNAHFLINKHTNFWIKSNKKFLTSTSNIYRIFYFYSLSSFIVCWH